MAPAARASSVAKISSIAALSPSLSRAWMTIGRPRSTGHLDLADEGAALVVGRGGVAVEVEAGLADRPHHRVGAELGQRRLRLVVEALASLGWRPTLAKTGSFCSAWRDTSALVVSSSPTFSIRSTPAAAAASSSSAVGFSQRKRWVWESITRPRLGAGEARQADVGIGTGFGQFDPGQSGEELEAADGRRRASSTGWSVCSPACRARSRSAARRPFPAAASERSPAVSTASRGDRRG